MGVVVGRPSGFEGVADWELVSRCRTDLSAFGELYARHNRLVVRYCWRRLGDLATAEDLAEEVWLRVLRYVERIGDRDRPFEALLMVIARNTVVEFYRSVWGSRVARVPSDQVVFFDEVLEGPSESERVDDELQMASVGALLRSWAASLRGLQFEVVALRFFEGLSVAETALKLGVSEGAVKAATHRAVSRFRRSEMFGVLQTMLNV